jgi:hypothetical protein
LEQELEHYKQVDEENVRLRQDTYIMADEAQQAKAEANQLKQRLSQLNNENARLKLNFEQLKEKLAVLREFSIGEGRPPSAINSSPTQSQDLTDHMSLNL